MLVQAQAARHSNFSPSVDAGGRQMIGLNGRVLAPAMPVAIEVAMETLEGNLLVMRRAGNMAAAHAAAKAIEALGEQSDVLAGWLLDRLETERVDPAVLVRCIGETESGWLRPPTRQDSWGRCSPGRTHPRGVPRARPRGAAHTRARLARTYCFKTVPVLSTATSSPGTGRAGLRNREVVTALLQKVLSPELEVRRRA